MYCFCSICRKLEGASFGCNIMGKRATLRVRGRKLLRPYHPRRRWPGKRTEISEGTRWFCGACGTHLYATDDNWPDGVWPNVGAIDTPLPRAPEHVFMMTRYKPTGSSSSASAAARATPSTRSYRSPRGTNSHGLTGAGAGSKRRRAKAR